MKILFKTIFYNLKRMHIAHSCMITKILSAEVEGQGPRGGSSLGPLHRYRIHEKCCKNPIKNLLKKEFTRSV